MNTRKLPKKLREQVYIIDFSRLKSMIGRDEDLFYFYPQQLDGFIASTVASTQREHEDPAIVDRFAYNDLYHAFKDFQRMEEESAWRSGKWETGTYNGVSIDDYELAAAGRTAEVVTDFVLRQMAVIRDAHGDYALSPDDFVWTPNNALMLKVYY